MGCQKPAGHAWQEPQFVQLDQRPGAQSEQTFGALVYLPRPHVLVSFTLQRACFLSSAQFTQPAEVVSFGHLTQ